ncbi:hypothetical protein VHUM_01545 [Vanrija humicola]|uniref:Syntaxin-5 N-terminal Sly1p-binding domain-containing protein n=1 Tax=Vanrija humicola TaxID=5417 RepID=A0A7D8V0V7_VANHU|nr:hypothetical protein VHUM_01545 [Vanrija humicola]
MAPRDRTAEFHSALSSIKARTALPAKKRDGAKQPLLAAGPSSSKSEFGRLAGNIAKDINNTTLKLQKLAQLAKRKTLFDDRPIEISELTYIIRQDIASLNTQIAGLQAFVRANKPPAGSGKQVEEHNSNVVMMLQSRLANMGMGFKDVLELRTQNMKASRDRTEQFMHSASSAAVPLPAKGVYRESPKTRRADTCPQTRCYSTRRAGRARASTEKARRAPRQARAPTSSRSTSRATGRRRRGSTTREGTSRCSWSSSR